MSRVLAIAINTFREAVRDKVLFGVVLLAVAMLSFSFVLGELSLDQQERVVNDIGVATISLLSVVVAIFLGSSLLYKEIERKTLYVILPKPIERWEFLLGKFLGILLTGITFVAITGAFQLHAAAIQAGIATSTLGLGLGATFTVLAIAAFRWRDASAILLPWSAFAFVVAYGCAATSNAILAPLVAQFTLTVVELAVTASVALVFSSFSTPFLTGAFTFGVWLVGRSADSMIAMPGRTLPPEIKSLLAGLAWVVPNNDLFFPGRSVLLAEVAGRGSPAHYVAYASGYGLLYATVMLAVASAIFARRDFT